jgi:hypothetical protein
VIMWFRSSTDHLIFNIHKVEQGMIVWVLPFFKSRDPVYVLPNV